MRSFYFNIRGYRVRVSARNVAQANHSARQLAALSDGRLAEFAREDSGQPNTVDSR